MRAYLVIWGVQCDPAEITQRTGIDPAKAWRIGEVRYAKTAKLHTDSGWQIEAVCGGEATADALIDALLNKVWHAAGYLSLLRSSCELQVNIVVHCHGHAPPMAITAANIQRLAEIGAAVDIDLYC